MAIIKKEQGQSPSGNGGQLQRRTGGRADPFSIMRDLMRFDPFGVMMPFQAAERMWTPQFEVRETNDAFLFTADVPGLKEDDLEVHLTGNRLAISGKREREEEEREGDTVYAYERSFGSFHRAFTLPDNADTDHVRAELEKGVLTLVVPKRPGAQPKKIQISTTGSKS